MVDTRALELSWSTKFSRSGLRWAETLLSKPHATGTRLSFSAAIRTARRPGMYTLPQPCRLAGHYLGAHVETVLLSNHVEVSFQAPAVFSERIRPVAVSRCPSRSACCRRTHWVELVLSDEWQPVAGFLVVLAAAGVFRPINSIASSLLMASERNALLLGAEFIKVVVLLGGMWALSPLGEISSAASVAVAMGLQAGLLVYVLGRTGFPTRDLARNARGPALAAVILIFAVVATRSALDQGAAIPIAAQLAVEVIAGAVAYCLGAWIFAREAVSELIEVARAQLYRR